MGLFNPYCNSCDGIYCSLDIHFTPTCDNRCPFCIDSKNRSQMQCKPNVDEISKTIISHEDMFNDVLFLGGEPCLYLHDLVECISRIKSETSLKVYVTTSVPYICFKEKDLFFRLVELVDGVNISAQHYDEKIGDEIRGTKSAYDRQKFYNSFPPSIKKKIRVTVNLVKPYFTKKDEILELLHHYDEMGFGSILIRELQHAPDYFVSFEKTMNMRLPSAYAHGCQSLVDIPGENFTTPIILKRSCSLVESTVEVTWSDILKVATKFFKPRPKNNFAVVWQDGSLRKGW